MEKIVLIFAYVGLVMAFIFLTVASFLIAEAEKRIKYNDEYINGSFDSICNYNDYIDSYLRDSEEEKRKFEKRNFSDRDKSKISKSCEQNKRGDL